MVGSDGSSSALKRARLTLDDIFRHADSLAHIQENCQPLNSGVDTDWWLARQGVIVQAEETEVT